MKLFFDEDCGTRVPRALKDIGLPVADIAYPTSSAAGPLPKGTSDSDWLKWVGNNGYLAISRNVRIMRKPDERAALLSAAAGAVFIDAGQEPVWKLLRRILDRFEWCIEIDRSERRPFAYRLRMTGNAERFDFATNRWRR